MSYNWLVVTLLVFFFIQDTIALRVLVTGASGKLGRLVVQELSIRPDIQEVLACVRNETKAQEIFSNTLMISNSNNDKQMPKNFESISIKEFDLEKTIDIKTQLCNDNIDHVIWCAAGNIQIQQQPKNLLDKFLDIFKGGNKKKEVIDISAVREISKILSEREKKGKLILCSSAGVTRPTWSDEKKKKLIGCSDIPIVRLNPGNILGTKLDSENIVRNTQDLDYCIVRPCGLNDNHPSGRPILTQGDVAVGRINRQDVASLLVDILFEKTSSGKTFEAISIPEYPKPTSYTEQLSRFQLDTSGDIDEIEVNAIYGLMQQLVPGEQLAPQNLAMGQTYEQLDKGETGRLGERGKEVLPERLGGDNEPNASADVGIKKI